MLVGSIAVPTGLGGRGNTHKKVLSSAYFQGRNPTVGIWTHAIPKSICLLGNRQFCFRREKVEETSSKNRKRRTEPCKLYLMVVNALFA